MNKMIKTHLIIFLALFLPLMTLAAEEKQQTGQNSILDILYMEEGEEYLGMLIEIADGNITFKTNDGRMLNTSEAEVQRIEFCLKRPGDTWKTAKDITDPRLISIINAQPEPQDYSKDESIQLYHKRTYRLYKDGSSSRTVRSMYKIFKEKGKSIGNQSFYYLKKHESIHLDFARSINSEGKVTSIRDSAISDTSTNVAYPEYENQYKYQFAVPNIDIGTIIDFQVTLKREPHDWKRPFYVLYSFQGDTPRLNTTLEVHVPKGKEFVWDKRHFEDYNLVFSKIEHKDGAKTLAFHLAEIERLEYEPNMPPDYHLVPELIGSEKYTWEELAMKYKEAIQPILAEDEGLDAKMDDFLASLETDAPPKAYIKALTEKIAKNIRLIPVAPYEDTYLPRNPQKVLANGAGTELDTAFLLYAMLKKVDGIEPTFCEVRTKYYGPIYKDVPLLWQNYSWTVYVKADGEEYFLFPFSEYYPFNVIQGWYQGAEVFAIDPTFETHFLTVPMAKAKNEGLASNNEVWLNEDGSIKVETKFLAFGSDEASARDMKNYSAEQVKKYVQSWVSRIHPWGELTDYTMENLEDLDKQVKRIFRYTVEDYAVRSGKSFMMVKLPNWDYSTRSVSLPEREFPMYYETRDRNTHRYKVHLPDGYKVKYHPKPMSLECESLKYTITWSVEGNTLIMEDEKVQKTNEVPVSDYGDYRDILSKAALNAKEWIVLEKE